MVPAKNLTLDELLQLKSAWNEERVLLTRRGQRKCRCPPGLQPRWQKPIEAKDLEGNWCCGRDHFAMSKPNAQVSLHGFARETTNRQYKVGGPESFWEVHECRNAAREVEPTQPGSAR